MARPGAARRAPARRARAPTRGARARRRSPAVTRTVRPLRRTRTSTAPSVTRVFVPPQRSAMPDRVPRTVATLSRPWVRKRPPLSLPHRRRTGLRPLAGGRSRASGRCAACDTEAKLPAAQVQVGAARRPTRAGGPRSARRRSAPLLDGFRRAARFVIASVPSRASTWVDPTGTAVAAARSTKALASRHPDAHGAPRGRGDEALAQLGARRWWPAHRRAAARAPAPSRSAPLRWRRSIGRRCRARSPRKSDKPDVVGRGRRQAGADVDDGAGGPCRPARA